MAIKVSNKAVKMKDDLDLVLPYLLKSSKTINSEINAINRQIQDKVKKDIIKTALNDLSKPFFVSSKHSDSAKDHKDWQGKLYVNERVLNNDEIRVFCVKHNVLTIQWVMGEPVWFLTRPNCRHYFRQYSFDEIKDGYTIPTRKIGDRRLATLKTSDLNFYKDRLVLLEMMQPKTQLIKDKILKTKLLIQNCLQKQK